MRTKSRVGHSLTIAGVCMLASFAVLPWARSLAAQGAASAGPADAALIEDLIAANRILYQQEIVDGYGHVSVRHNRDSNRFLMSRSLAPDLVTADDLIEYDLDGNPINLNGRAQYSERFIHAAIYKARPDVISVVHSHSPAVVPFSVSSQRLRAVDHMGAFIGDGIPVFDLRARFGDTEMLVNSLDRGRALAVVLGDGPAVLIRGHGVAVVGPSLKYSVGRSIYLASNARVQAQAMALGGPVTYISPGESRAVMGAGENNGYERPWEMWKREAMKRQ